MNFKQFIQISNTQTNQNNCVFMEVDYQGECDQPWERFPQALALGNTIDVSNDAKRLLSTLDEKDVTSNHKRTKFDDDDDDLLAFLTTLLPCDSKELEEFDLDSVDLSNFGLPGPVQPVVIGKKTTEVFGVSDNDDELNTLVNWSETLDTFMMQYTSPETEANVTQTLIRKLVEMEKLVPVSGASITNPKFTTRKTGSYQNAWLAINGRIPDMSAYISSNLIMYSRLKTFVNEKIVLDYYLVNNGYILGQVAPEIIAIFKRVLCNMGTALYNQNRAIISGHYYIYNDPTLYLIL